VAVKHRDKQKQLGQVFTPQVIARLMVNLSSQSTDAAVLEPAAGAGVFLDVLKERGFGDIAAYEIDQTVVPAIHSKDVTNRSFISAYPGELNPEQFGLIIGNPPYVRWKNMSNAQQLELREHPLWTKHFNSLCDLLFYFIAASIELLEDNGELIFITPGFWMNTLHAKNLRKLLINQGRLQTMIEFGEAQLFPGVATDIIIFKFIKDTNNPMCSKTTDLAVYQYQGGKKIDLSKELILEQEQFKHSVHPTPDDQEPWVFLADALNKRLLRLEEACEVNGRTQTLADVAEIANGMVSGLDAAFRWPAELPVEPAIRIRVVKAKQIDFLKTSGESAYIWLEDITAEHELKREQPGLYKYLRPWRDRLQKRYDYGRGTKYWQWSLPRSLRLFQNGQRKILVPCKERLTNKERLRAAVVEARLMPTQDVAAIIPFAEIREEAEYFVGLLSSKAWYQWVSAKGLIRDGRAEFTEAPLARIPIKRIDWGDAQEVQIYQQIVELVKNHQNKPRDLERLDDLVEGLITSN